MTFLPKDYEAPKPESSGYMKFKEEGAHKLRILTPAITGYEYFTNENKPKRFKVMPDKIVDLKTGGKVRHFWTFVVWNYRNEAIEILTINQSTIQDQMLGLIENPDWGDPLEYDLTINRKGLKMDDTEYTVQPSPSKPVSPIILQAFKEKPINLEALFDNGNPFEVK